MVESLNNLPREERVTQIFKDTRALLEGHFVGASYKHLDAYVDKRLIYPHTKETSELCGMFAQDFKDKNVEVVVSPATGGIILSFETARQLTNITGKDVVSVFLEKKREGGFEIHGNLAQEAIKDKRTLILDDVGTTGGSLIDVVNEVKKVGANIIGVGLIWNRGGVTPKDIGLGDEIKIDSLNNAQLPSWTEEDCNISGPCSKGIPVNIEVGRGKEYLAKKQANSA